MSHDQSRIDTETSTNMEDTALREAALGGVEFRVPIVTIPRQTACASSESARDCSACPLYQRVIESGRPVYRCTRGTGTARRKGGRRTGTSSVIESASTTSADGVVVR